MTTTHLCDCDTVLEMESMGVGVSEILQYVRGVLTSREISTLLVRLESVLNCEPQEEPLQCAVP